MLVTGGLRMIIDLSIDTEKEEDCEYVKKILGFLEETTMVNVDFIKT